MATHRPTHIESKPLHPPGEIQLPIQTAMKHIIKKAYPITLSVTLITISRFLRIYLLSQLNQEDFAGEDLAAGVQSFIFSPCMSLLKQNAIFAASEYGKLKKDSTINPGAQQRRIGTILKQAWILSLIGSIFVVSLILLSRPTFFLLSVPEPIIESAETYLYPFMLAVPAKLVLYSNQRFLVAVNKEKWLMPFTVGSIICGMTLDYILIKSMNSIKGAAWSSVLQSLLAVCMYTIFFLSNADIKKYHLFSIPRFSELIDMKKMISQGWPYSVQDMILSGRVLLFKAMMSRYGTIALVMDQVSKLFFRTIEDAIPQAISEASNRLTAQALGAALLNNKKYLFENVRRYGNLNVVYSQAFFLSLGLLCLILHKPLSSIFMKQEDINNHATALLLVYFGAFLKYFFNVSRRSVSSNLSAVQDTFLSSAMSVISTVCITLPLALLTSSALNLGQFFLYASVAVGLLVDTLIIGKHWLTLSQDMVRKSAYEPETASSNATLKRYLSNCKLKKLPCSRQRPGIFHNLHTNGGSAQHKTTEEPLTRPSDLN